MKTPWFSSLQNAQGVTTVVFEGFDGGGNFEDFVADSVQAIGTIGAGEEFGFDDARPVGDGDEFHWFTGDLMEQALLDDQTAGDDLLADMFAQAIDRAIGMPGDVGIEFERMAADGVAKQLFFPSEALEAIGFRKRNGREALRKSKIRMRKSERILKLQIRRIIATVIRQFGVWHLDLFWVLRFGFRIWAVPSRAPLITKSPSCFEFPVLNSAGFAEFVEGAGADQSFHFFAEWLDADDEILERAKGVAGVFAQNGFFGLEGEAFNVGERNANTRPKIGMTKFQRIPKL